MTNRRGVISSALCLVWASASWPGEPGRSVTVAPGSRYRAGWLYSFFLGEHWRNAWTTPIEVPVLDLESVGGGMRPARLGGGLETKNLHFKSADGRTWAFRSVDKDPTRLLDPDTRNSLIGDLFQDETSTAHPYGALIVPALLDAADVLHSTPRLYVLPDDPRLGEYPGFAGMVGVLEERIEGNVDGATKVADTPTLFQRLEQRSDEQVDARAYLRARLIDILVGDWDRHVDQWRWVRVERDGKRVWEPVPRDRDQAFSRFDGVIPSIAEYYTKQIAGFGPSYAPIDKLTFAGRFTDRRFLVPLDKAEWESVTSELMAKLTDAAISDAVHRLPHPLYEQDGQSLERALRSRRDALPAISRDFYQLLADQVDVRGTGQGEEFHIQREASGDVEVAIYALDAETGKRSDAPYFRRRFLSEATSEIRLYTTGGAHRIEVTGETEKTIAVRVVAPPGTVQIADRSSHQGAIGTYAPLPDGPLSASTIRSQRVEAAKLTNHYETFRDWGSDSLFFPQFSYDSTRGLVFGATLERTGYGFQLDPFSSVMKFAAAYSTGTNRPRLEYSADVRTRSPVRGLLYVTYSGMDVAQYYGKGNETVKDDALSSASHYDVRQEIIVVDPMIEVPMVGPLRGRAGLSFKHAFSVTDSGILNATQPEGSNGMSLGSGEVGLTMDTRGGTFPFQRGIFFEMKGRHTPEIFSNPAAFTNLRGELSGTFGWHFLSDLQLSARVAGEKNWGTYPFFESAFVGGAASRLPLDVTGVSTGNLLRGYALNRFAGDASVVGNTEIDAPVGKFSLALPFRWGVTALADVGRVFVEGENSSKWHAGYGGGLWLGVFASGINLDFASALKAMVVHSDEGTSFYLMSGFTL